MNKINFYSGDKFPQYRQALAKMQDMTLLVAKLAGLGGKNYILSGCELGDKDTVSDGVIVINGEIIPFEGSAKKDKIAIVETRQDVTAHNVVYPETYINRIAKFSDAGEYSWSEFEQIKSNTELYKIIKDIAGDAPGTIKEWAGSPGKVPTDYMLCDGRDLPISEYRELYETIGVTFGGDGLNTFKLPNTGGLFSVGYSGTDDYAQIGNTGGEEKHKLTIGEMPRHNPANNNIFNKLSARAADVSELGTPGSVDQETPDKEYNVGNMTNQRWDDATIKDIGNDEPHENRPPFIVFAKIIKVR
ncbi:tail fiber protein [Dysgonomonas sp. Marseille-P4361]|uniref:tail fiber protein n=1 Tax=Dysgonomonas sp. Marseille-P4361 TaxID=2161820 RepID=UPI000D559999|nr:tail fiber protein [Dysgonomonas sp. Marseille-P4361]